MTDRRIALTTSTAPLTTMPASGSIAVQQVTLLAVLDTTDPAIPLNALKKTLQPPPLYVYTSLREWHPQFLRL